MVNIITKHYSHNLGAMLQAWALMSKLKKAGVECRILNYIKSKPELTSIVSSNNMINSAMFAADKKNLTRRYNRFEKFMFDEMDLTEEYRSKEKLYEMTDKADVYITGSDQVWNPLAMDEAYYLDFAKDSVKISYAASMGVSKLPEGAADSFKRLVNDMDHISVREESAKEIIEKYTGRNDVNVHVDPVFLLTEKEWDEMAGENIFSEPYILVYMLHKPKWLNGYLKKLHKNTGKKIVCVSENRFRNIYNHKMLSDVGPKEFLGLIKNADCVISSSFHGVAMSIVYHKPFYAVVNSNMPARINQVLKVFGLQDRIIDENSKPEIAPIDYLYVETRRIEEAERSMSYLLDAINAGAKRKKTTNINTIEKIGIECTGCSVCANVCPQSAVTMLENDEGFKYPKINAEKCINCGLCLKKCHQNKPYDNQYEQKIYFGKHISDEIRRKSSSGGMFSALAEKILEKGGVVYGAYFDPQIKKVRHTSTDEVAFEKLCRSKYVESDIGDTYSKIKTDLENGRSVLFCGTPCQAAGLKSFAGDDDKLIIADFLCHGVPSSKVFKDYLNELESKYNDKIKDYQFRSKFFGWSEYGLYADFAHKGIKHNVGRCDYMYVSTMADSLFLRKSCYFCEKPLAHESDITIGDFWGVFKYDPKLNDNKGLSVIMVNTEKGEKILSEIQDITEMTAIDKKHIMYTLRNKHNYSGLKLRNTRFKEYNKIGFKAFMDKYYKNRILKSRLVFNAKKLINSNYRTGVK